MAGPGTFLGGGGAIPSIIACSTVGGNHGSFDGSFFGSFEIPANTATSFTMKFATGDPPWPGDSLAPTFVLGRDVQSPSLPAAIEVPTAEPIRQGPSGVQIAFATRPATPVLARAPQTTFKAGKRVKLFGSTNPVVRDQKLRIFTVVFTKNQKGRPKPVTLAKVRTDANGRFAYTDWRPDKPGFYEVGVTYRSQRAFLTDDFACSHSFELTK